MSSTVRDFDSWPIDATISKCAQDDIEWACGSKSGQDIHKGRQERERASLVATLDDKGRVGVVCMVKAGQKLGLLGCQSSRLNNGKCWPQHGPKDYDRRRNGSPGASGSWMMLQETHARTRLGWLNQPAAMSMSMYCIVLYLESLRQQAYESQHQSRSNLAPRHCSPALRFVSLAFKLARWNRKWHNRMRHDTTRHDATRHAIGIHVWTLVACV